MRKMIKASLCILGVLCFLNAASAKDQSGESCGYNEQCFYVSEVALPSGSIEQYSQYATLSKRFNTGGERTFVFSPRLKEWAAYDSEGYLVANGIANGGADFCEELGHPCHTPVGVFRVQHKGSADCVSKRFPLGVGGAEMPYCMFFSGGNAIHGSPYISNRNGSHGCIRVHTSAAKWLSQYFMAPGTKVVVLSY